MWKWRLHNQNRVKRFLKRWVKDKWTGKNGPNHWQAGCPDLTTPDCYLRGYVNGEVYREKSTRPEDMKNGLREVFGILKDQL